MTEQSNGPDRKVPSKNDSPENTEGKRPGDRQPPAAAERTDREESADEQPLSNASEPAKRQPVTNQDEQEKITNAGASDIPIAEE